MARRALPDAVLPLKQFLLRSQVLAQYKQFWRLTHYLDGHEAKDLQRQIREGFRQHAAEGDSAYVRTLLVHGKRQLDQLHMYVTMARPQAVVPPLPDEDYESDSSGRLFAEDDHDPSTQEFVVGTDWPWNR